MAEQHRGRHGQGRGGPDHQSRGASIELGAIVLKPPEGGHLDPELFDRTARAVADKIAENQRGNKPAQIRQFYEELVMWEERARMNPQSFDEFLPFMRMLNAKAAYAEGRQNVDANFKALMAHCLGQVDDPASLRNFKLFFEAFLGFYKLVGPKG